MFKFQRNMIVMQNAKRSAISCRGKYAVYLQVVYPLID